MSKATEALPPYPPIFIHFEELWCLIVKLIKRLQATLLSMRMVKINLSLFSSWNTNISNSLLLPWDSIVSFNTLPNSNKFMMLLIVFVTFVCICTSKTELTCQIKSPGHILCIISIFFCHFILTYCSKITRWKNKVRKEHHCFHDKYLLWCF